MQRINDYDVLSELIARQMKRGLCTNAFYSREEYEREINAGRIFAQSWPSGLAVIADRGDYDRLSFWLTDLEAPIPIELRRTTVLEIAARPKDLGLSAAGDQWEAYGFKPLFGRIRLAHSAWDAPKVPVDTADAQDLEEITSLMLTSFHPIAGCIPTKEELLRELTLGNILCIRDDSGKPAAMLHYSENRNAAKLQHLTVRQDHRRQGYASALFSAFQSRTKGKRSVVWTQADNLPAIAFYKFCGYQADGWTSKVWLYQE